VKKNVTDFVTDILLIINNITDVTDFFNFLTPPIKKNDIFFLQRSKKTIKNDVFGLQNGKTQYCIMFQA